MNKENNMDLAIIGNDLKQLYVKYGWNKHLGLMFDCKNMTHEDFELIYKEIADLNKKVETK